MSSGARILIGLVAGLATGIVISTQANPLLLAAAHAIEPVGILWLNALRMTVIPLVVSLLITGIASAAETASTGRLAARSMLLFLALLIVSAGLSALLMPLLLHLWPVDASAAQALRVGAAAATTQVPVLPSLRDWMIGLIPVNPFEAAATGAMLPLVVFSLVFGFAAAKTPASARASLLSFFDAVVQTMLVIVHWIFIVAPAGVFALALEVGLRGGINAVGGLAEYVVLMCAMSIVVAALFYPLVALFSATPVWKFAQAAAPVQVFALTTQSSLACLPSMLEVSNSQLKLSPRASALVLPLAVSMFRVTSPIVNLAIVQFVAHVYGVHIDFVHMTAGVAVAVITNFAVVGLPSQLTFFNSTVPISLAMGVPTPLLGLLLAIEVVPDIFRTIGNVTGDLGVTALLDR